MKKTFLLMLITLTSCLGSSEINFELQNDSDIDYDSIVITGLGKLRIENLRSGKATEGILDYSRSKTRTDGSYRIRLYNKDTVRQQHFGYYSNGLPSTEHTVITIKNDTVLVKDIFND